MPTIAMFWVKKIPAAMVAVRLLIAPLLIVGGVWEWPRLWLVIMVGTAFWLDVFDGICARKLDVSSPELRRADSCCDVVFYLAVVACIAITEPNIFHRLQWFIAGLVGMEIFCQILSLYRFGCSTSTHCWSCKIWGVLLCLAATFVIGRGETGPLVYATLIGGFLAYLDVLLILLFSDVSPVDVPSAWHAWKSRQPVSLQQK